MGGLRLCPAINRKRSEGMRTFLFVPADNERKLAKAQETHADALVFDLEDSVLPARKAMARQMLSSYTWDGRSPPRIWIRVNGPDSPDLLSDLAAVVPVRPIGIVLPKIRGPEDVRVVSEYLTMAEAIHGVASGSIKIIPVCTETPSALLRLSEFATVRISRLAGLLWGGEDLSTAMGAADPRTPEGSWRAVYQHARTQCLLTAHALEVMAIDTVFVDVRDSEGCRRSALEARDDGFTGKVAIHPEQVPIINAAFTPTLEQLERARRIVTAFEGGQGVVAFDGKMLDIPHLKAARRLLASRNS
jgi:citrate lyase subunit beta/citryl-CoA lyase